MRAGLVVAALSAALAGAARAGGAVDFASRPALAGRASLAGGGGYVVRHGLGTARFSPGLEIPVELVYDSSSEACGPFGFAWRSPQLESSVRWDGDGMLWTAPWGERVKFYPKNGRTPKDAVRLGPIEEAKRGRGYYAPYSEWEADVVSGNPARGASWVVRGRRGKVGWSFLYEGRRLVRVAAPSGKSLDLAYGGDGLASVSQDGVAFVELAYAGGRAVSVTVGGVRHALAYEDRTLEIPPRTADGRVARPTLPQLVSAARGSLAPVVFGYRGNFLASIRRGGAVEDIAFETVGRVARIMSDREFDYSYAGGVTLTDRLGRRASYDYDARAGVFRITEFSGRRYTVYYFMRHDVAYLGRVRKIVDGRGDDLVAFRYDAGSGNVTRVRDRLGNDRNFEYDDEGRLVRATRRAAGSWTSEPVASFAYGGGRRPTAVSLLDGRGEPAVTVRIAYDASGRPVSVDDGRGAAVVEYNRAGYPVSVRGPLGPATGIRYDRFNVPVSCTDGEGRTTACDRDALGRVIGERYADDSGVAYAYDALGRLAGVLDENGHEIRFGWDRFGLSRRTTAAGQVTDYVRDDDGLVAEIVSSQGGRAERTIRREYDDLGRVTRVDYGSGEVETFWGGSPRVRGAVWWRRTPTTTSGGSLKRTRTAPSRPTPTTPGATGRCASRGGGTAR